MALIRTGGEVGQISGRIGANVWSRNRYGSYVRQGTIPVTSTTPFAIEAKARMTECTQAWQSLTAGERQDWGGFADANPVLNRIGQSIKLTGHAMYVSVNTRMLAMALAKLTTPPLGPPPLPLLTISLTADIGLGGASLAFTATPLGANDRLYLWGCLLQSAGINFVENYLRRFNISIAAPASPFDYQAVFEARLGTMVVGEIVVMRVAVINDLTGLVSADLRGQATVITT